MRPERGVHVSRAAWWWHLVLVPLLLAVLAALVEFAGLDRTISSRFYVKTQGFVGQALPWMELVGHRGARLLPIALGVTALALAAASWRSAALARWRKPALLVACALIAITLLINVLKPSLAAYCPYQLDLYGGQVPAGPAAAQPLWLPITSAGGDCLPSAHAGGGYALLALYFAGWLAGSRRLRWAGLAAGIAGGLLFSVVRVSQGAHFASQTLWSAAVAWTVAAWLFALFVRLGDPARRGRVPDGREPLPQSAGQS